MDVSVVCGKYNQSILHVLLSAPARMEKVEETDIVKFEKCLAAILKCDDGRLNPIINHKAQCAPGFFKPDQKFRRQNLFWYLL